MRPSVGGRAPGAERGGPRKAGVQEPMLNLRDDGGQLRDWVTTVASVPLRRKGGRGKQKGGGAAAEGTARGEVGMGEGARWGAMKSGSSNEQERGGGSVGGQHEALAAMQA